MSWQIAFEMSAEDVKKNGLDVVEESPHSDNPDQVSQVAAAKSAIKSLVESGVLGDDVIAGTISGHAVKDNKPVISPSALYPSVSMTLSGLVTVSTDN